MGVIKFKKKAGWLGKKAAVDSLPPSLVADMPRRIKIPPAPTHNPNGSGSEKALYDEQQVARLEVLMLKGVRDKRMLMGFLGIEHGATLDRYLDRVNARWELLGADTDMAKVRGELLRKLDLLEHTTWDRFDGAVLLASKDNVAYIKTLIAINAQRADILGVSAKTMAQMAGRIDAGASEFSTTAAQHDRLTMLAGRMVKVLENRIAASGEEVPEDENGEPSPPDDRS